MESKEQNSTVILIDKTVITTESHRTTVTFKDAYHATKSLLKGVTGLLALGVGGALVASGLPFAVLVGAVAVYSGGRQTYEAGRELLPLKAQSAISKLFGGKEVTEKKHAGAPKTVLGKIGRVLEFATVTFAGAGVFAAGSFAIGFGGEISRATAALMLGGIGLGVAGATNIVDQGVKGSIGLLKYARNRFPAVDRAVKSIGRFFKRGQNNDVTPPVVATPVPDVAPVSKVATLSVDSSFNNAVTPAVAAAPEAKPQPVVAPPQP